MKYIFIDSNQYRHLFSRSDFSDSFYKFILKIVDNEHIKLLLPQQTKEEVERNRFHDWPAQELESLDNKIVNLFTKRERLCKDFSNYDYKKIVKKIDKEIKDLKKEKINIPHRFKNVKSKQNKKLKKLFESACYIPDTEEILTRADLRFKKGNPPYDNDNFGDSLIWESVLSYLEKEKGAKPELIFVASDNDAWGSDNLNLWLEKEYKERVKGRVHYSKKLSDIPGLTKEEQAQIRKKENQELKNNAVNAFVNSNSFMNAGQNARKLLQYKQLLDVEDYKKIFLACLKNHEIYQSFFTSGPVNLLFDNGKGYVVDILEHVKMPIWKKFCQIYDCRLKRQCDQEKNEIRIEDIPF